MIGSTFADRICGRCSVTEVREAPVGLTTAPPRPGEVSFRATVIAAARAAGLYYHQHIPAVLAPLPGHEPRTAPEHPTEANDGRRLLAGRHLPTFRDLLAFGTTATGEETADV